MPQTRDRPARRRVLPAVVRDRRGSGMRGMVGAVSADVRMVRAISADVVHAADPRHFARWPPAADPFEAPPRSEWVASGRVGRLPGF